MSDDIARQLTGWSSAQLAERRKAARRLYGRGSLPDAGWSRVNRLRSVLPAETVDSAIARSEADNSGPVGESLAVTFDQLSPKEQLRWRALAAIDSLSPSERAEEMRGPSHAEEADLRLRGDEAIRRANQRAVTYFEGWEKAERLRLHGAGAPARARARELEDSQRRKQGLPAKYLFGTGDPASHDGPAQGRLFTDAELDESIPDRLKLRRR